MREHSGISMKLYLHTVAGAASDLIKTLPTSHLTIGFEKTFRNLKAETIIRGCIDKANLQTVILLNTMMLLF